MIESVGIRRRYTHDEAFVYIPYLIATTYTPYTMSRIHQQLIRGYSGDKG